MINRIKGIKVGLNHLTLNELNEMIIEFKNDILNYEINKDQDYEEILIQEYEINKLYKMLKDNDLFNMRYDYIPIYLDKLIAIIEFMNI